VLEREVAAFDVPELQERSPQAFAEPAGSAVREHADARELRRRLGPGLE
jgi:hypothetical protein